MKSAKLVRMARLLALPVILAGAVSAAQLGTADIGCAFEKGKCYKLIFHPT